MNTKITYPELIDALTEVSGKPKRVCEQFLKEFFALIQTSLTEGDVVKIKKFGTFKLTNVDARKSINVNTGEEMDIPAHKKVVFVPDKDIAETINLPFESFETIELPDEISDEELSEVSPIPSDIPQSENNENLDQAIAEDEISISPAEPELPIVEEPIEEVVSEPIVTPQPSTTEITEQVSAVTTEIEEPKSEMLESETLIESKEDNVAEQTPIITPKTEEMRNDSQEEKNSVEEDAIVDNFKFPDEISNAHSRDTRFAKGFFWGFVAAVVISFLSIFMIGQFSGFPIVLYTQTVAIPTTATDVKAEENNVPNEDAMSQIEAIKQQSGITKSADEILDEVKNTPIEEPSDESTEVKTDVIGKTRFLTTMARQYYGDYNFWVYIYEENGNLGNPNKIKPGTKVIIPPASKYNIDAKDPKSLNAAKRKSFEILSKYE